MPKLVLMFKRKELSAHILLDGSTVTIGRFRSNDIVIRDLVVSGLHAHVDCHGNELQLTDLESKNGTFLNGEKVTQAPLHHKDVITIGKHSLLVDLLDEMAEGQDNRVKRSDH